MAGWDLNMSVPRLARMRPFAALASTEDTPILRYNESKAQDIPRPTTLRCACDELRRILSLAWPVILAELVQTLPLVYNLRMAGMLVRAESSSNYIYIGNQRQGRFLTASYF